MSNFPFKMSCCPSLWGWRIEIVSTKKGRTTHGLSTLCCWETDQTTGLMGDERFRGTMCSTVKMRLLLFAVWAKSSLHRNKQKALHVLFNVLKKLSNCCKLSIYFVWFETTCHICSCNESVIFYSIISTDCCHYVTLQTRGAELLHPLPRKNR